ncbi:MAG TPA: ParB/RepB/Spo0J family partition protein [Candidatus Saccharimonadales bacterium]|nr:ParB/RepB/Spo0J family partition protein [Candidatus Saccharimonadales bacterium]
MAGLGSKKTGLGRGFDALLPQNFDSSLLLTDDDRIQRVDVGKVKPNPNQPRTYFDEETLGQLASSIKQFGILQPLVVTPLAGGEFEIIAGERRWRAAQLAGLDKVPVIVRSTKELEQLEIALIENVQRVDLSPLEQAVSIERLHQQFNMNYDAIAKRLGKAPSTINNIVRLLQLPPSAREALQDKKITEGHARAILSLKDAPERQEELLWSIINQGWSVRQAERYVTSHKAGVQDKEVVKQRVDTQTAETKALGERLNTDVHIRRTAKGGKLELKFTSDEELQRLINLLESIQA